MSRIHHCRAEPLLFSFYFLARLADAFNLLPELRTTMRLLRGRERERERQTQRERQRGSDRERQKREINSKKKRQRE